MYRREKAKQKKVLTLDEQYTFLEFAKNRVYYNQFAFILQTGLRIGELIGLKWSDIDFQKKVVHVQRTMEYSSSTKNWRIGEPKSRSGYRYVPLTQEAIQILIKEKEKRKK